MKLKRNSTFLIMVFVLSGCVSDVPIKGTLNNTNQTATAVPATQLSYRKSSLAALEASAQSEVSLKDEIASYAVTKKLNKRLIDQGMVQSAFQAVMEKSQAEQYEPPETETEVSAEETSEVIETFNVKTTLYGVDCHGCNIRPDGTGNTATGVQLNPAFGVMQSDGTWLDGLTYDGYYIIATDSDLPFYSIVEISNHGLSGMGFSPEEPIQCIVLDRGGKIKGNHIDLYIGSEKSIRNISYNGSQAVAKVLRYGR